MPIDPSMAIKGIGPALPGEWNVGSVGALDGTPVTGAASGASGSFGQLLTNQLGSLEKSQNDAASASRALADGTATDPTAAIVAVAGVFPAAAADRTLGPDDGRIVIDEVAGMTLALAGVPATATGAAIAFALFRIFDIAKPPPVSWGERWKGAAGVMLDDVLAGALAALAAAMAFALWPALGR